MTEAEAQAKLERITDSDVEPTLTADDLADLLDHAARVDASGLYRSDAAWTPTWDLNAGAAEGWRRKAGRAAGRFSFGEDGQRFERAQVYAHCLRQAEQYARTEQATADVSTTISDD